LASETSAAFPIGPDHQPPAHAGGDSIPAKRSHPRLWFFLTLIAVLAGIGVFFLSRRKPGLSESSATRNGGSVTITTANGKSGSIGVYLDSIGTVTPVYTASITAQA
jgi:multidrug efflux system membrane fusion protein